MTGSQRTRMVVLVAAMAMGGFQLLGCQHVVNVYHDETISADDITTPTAEAVHRQAQPVEHTTRPRPGDWPEVHAVAHSGSVSHWPLWFEDSVEDQGSEDGRFAVTWEDYAAWPYSTGRWMVNLVALPVSAVVTPPFTIMSSDGVLSRGLLGYLHDAEVGPGQAKDVGEAESLTVTGTVVQNMEDPEPEFASE